MAKNKIKNQGVGSDLETKSFEELQRQVASYFCFGRQFIINILGLFPLKKLRRLDQAFQDIVSCDEYVTYKGNILIAKDVDDDLKLALETLISLYELDKTHLRGINSAAMTMWDLNFGEGGNLWK